MTEFTPKETTIPFELNSINDFRFKVAGKYEIEIGGTSIVVNAKKNQRLVKIKNTSDVPFVLNPGYNEIEIRYLGSDMTK